MPYSVRQKKAMALYVAALKARRKGESDKYKLERSVGKQWKEYPKTKKKQPTKKKEPNVNLDRVDPNAE